MKKGAINSDGFSMRHCQTLIPQSLHRKAVAAIDPREAALLNAALLVALATLKPPTLGQRLKN
jgi:hypothetical protein